MGQVRMRRPEPSADRGGSVAVLRGVLNEEQGTKRAAEHATPGAQDRCKAQRVEQGHYVYSWYDKNHVSIDFDIQPCDEAM